MENRTLRDWLEDDLLKDIAPDAISGRDLSKEKFYNWKIKKIDRKMRWKGLSDGFSAMHRNAEQGRYYYKLYSDEECAAEPEKKNLNITFFPAEGGEKKPYILLVPGGGFYTVWSLTEGWPNAKLFNDLGYTVFVLTYQIQTDGCAVKAMDAMAAAIEVIKKNKDVFKVDPDNYITCGFSAGGYIACLWNTEKGYKAHGIAKPQACFPIYPVTSYRLLSIDNWDEGDDKDAFARFGVGVGMNEACESVFEIPEHVEGFPPTAIFVSKKDELVDPKHSENLAKALENAGIPCRLEIGKNGGHGFGTGEGMCMEGWQKRAAEWFENLK